MKRILFALGSVLCVGWSALAFDMDQIQIHGFVSQGYLQSNHSNYLSAETEKGTVEFNEFGFNVISNLTNNLRLGIQLLARDLGDVGNDELRIDWAFGDYRYRNWLGVRAGKLKRVFGLHNQSRDIDAARNSIFLPLSVYPESFRLFQGSIIGIGGYGTLPGGFEYQAQYGTLDPEAERWLLTTPGVVRADAGDDGFALYLGWDTPLDGLRVIGSFNLLSWSQETLSGESLESETEIPQVGIDYSSGNFSCSAEYLQLKLIMNGQELTTTENYYGLLSYRFTEWLEVGASYGVNYADKDDKEGKTYEAWGMPKALAWRKDLTISTRFDINEYWIVKLEGHWIDGLSNIINYAEHLENLGENPEETGFLGAAKVTFSF